MILLEVHYKLFGTDGVSLQSLELSQELARRGWTVLPCASDVPEGAAGLRLDALSYQSRDAVELRSRLFNPADGQDDSGASLVAEVVERAAPIRAAVESYIDSQRVSIVHVRNIMALPYNLPATVALYDLMRERRDIGFLLQHHDLYWEGPNARNFLTPYAEVDALMERVMCPDLPNTRHVLINPIAADALQERRGLRGTVIPDGFDFRREVPVLDDERFRRLLRVVAGESAPITPADVIVAMPTRVAINKAIELALQLVAALQERRRDLERAQHGVGDAERRFTKGDRVVLLLPQGEDLADNQAYFDRLVEFAQHLGVTLAYGGDVVVPDRRYVHGDSEHFPFYATYRSVDFVCYCPEHEGFGNQAIESVWARRPLANTDYPVFKRFVAPHIPCRVSLGDPATLQRLPGWNLYELPQDRAQAAATAVIDVLTDHDLSRQWTSDDFDSLRAFCGIETVAGAYIRLYEELA